MPIDRNDIDEIYETAIKAGLADPSRRDLLLAWLPEKVRLDLPSRTSPGDQLRSDLEVLTQKEQTFGVPALTVWLENAERLTDYLPGVPSVFAAARRKVQCAVVPQVASPSTEAPPTTVVAPEVVADSDAEPARVEILFLSARPDDAAALHVGRELGQINKKLRTGLLGQRFKVGEVEQAVTPLDIQEFLRRSRAQILHFSGHGTAGGGLLLEDAIGRSVTVDADVLRDLLELVQDESDFRIGIFNACHSVDLAEILVRKPAVLPCAVATTDVVDDEVAIAFAYGFYSALADGKDVNYAYRAGRIQVGMLSSLKKNQKDRFVLLVADGVDVQRLLLNPKRP